MSRTKLFIRLILLILLTTTPIATAKRPSQLPEFPRQYSSWETPPIIVVCKGESPLSLNKVKKYLEEITLITEKVQIIVETECTNECDLIPHTITITGKSCTFENHKDEKGILAWTSKKTYYKKKETYIDSAVIELNSSSKIVFFHELMHAFGWTHCSTKGHLMYPYVDYMNYSLEQMYDY